jgi:NADPH:quinone reductase-like Zn-dependent oxidoreductase
MQASKQKRQAVKFEGGDFKLVTDETPQLKDKQVLIRVAYSPVTQFDKACLNIEKECDKCEGTLLGSEGCGTIEEVGSGLDQNLKGKKVSFCHNGWSQYCVQDFDHCMVFNDQVDLKLCATSVINPLTALSL